MTTDRDDSAQADARSTAGEVSAGESTNVRDVPPRFNRRTFLDKAMNTLEWAFSDGMPTWEYCTNEERASGHQQSVSRLFYELETSFSKAFYKCVRRGANESDAAFQDRVDARRIKSQRKLARYLWRYARTLALRYDEVLRSVEKPAGLAPAEARIGFTEQIAELQRQASEASAECAAARTDSPTPPDGRYSLVKGGNAWTLVFNGSAATPIKHGRGISYVAYLLLHPPTEPIHALDLANKVPEVRRRQTGLVSVVDPETGKTMPLDKDSRVQERSLQLDDIESKRALWEKRKECVASLENDRASEPEKAEAQRHLDEIDKYLNREVSRTRDSAEKGVRSVRRAIVRLHETLARSLDQDGKPHPVLTAFAGHLSQYLLEPSSRFSHRSLSGARTGTAGRFTYKPPPGVTWNS